MAVNVLRTDSRLILVSEYQSPVSINRAVFFYKSVTLISVLNIYLQVSIDKINRKLASTNSQWML